LGVVDVELVVAVDVGLVVDVVVVLVLGEKTSAKGHSMQLGQSMMTCA